MWIVSLVMWQSDLFINWHLYTTDLYLKVFHHQHLPHSLTWRQLVCSPQLLGDREQHLLWKASTRSTNRQLLIFQLALLQIGSWSAAGTRRSPPWLTFICLEEQHAINTMHTASHTHISGYRKDESRLAGYQPLIYLSPITVEKQCCSTQNYTQSCRKSICIWSWAALVGQKGFAKITIAALKIWGPGQTLSLCLNW